MESLQPSSKFFHSSFPFLTFLFELYKECTIAIFFFFKTEWESHSHLKKKVQMYFLFLSPSFLPYPQLHPKSRSNFEEFPLATALLHHILQAQPSPSNTRPVPPKCRNVEINPKGIYPAVRASPFLPGLAPRPSVARAL